MHVQPITFFPNFAKNILYHFCSSVLVFKHRKGITIEAFIPIGKSFFKYFLPPYIIYKAVIVKIQIGLCYFLKISCFWIRRRKLLIPLHVIKKNFFSQQRLSMAKNL